MWNSEATRLHRVLELMVTAFCGNQLPLILFQYSDQISAVHSDVVYTYTHESSVLSSKMKLAVLSSGPPLRAYWCVDM